MLWTSEKQNREFTAQITPSGGLVTVEIISLHKESKYGLYDPSTDLWMAVIYKTFGYPWNRAPREKDWQKANAFAEKQLALIEQYGTVIVTKPEFIRMADRLSKMK